MVKPRFYWLLTIGRPALCLVLLSAFAFGAHLATEPGDAGRLPLEKMLPELHLLEPPWRSEVVYRESVVFVQDAAGSQSLGKLLFPAQEILAVHRADGRAMFLPGRDYQLAADKRGLVLTAESSIPRLSAADLFPPKDAPRKPSL